MSLTDRKSGFVTCGGRLAAAAAVAFAAAFLLPPATGRAAEKSRCTSDPATCESVAKITAVWNRFMAELSARRPEVALSHVTPASREMFRSVIFAPGATPEGFARAVESFDVIEAVGSRARAVIVIPQSGQRYLYYVTFVRDPTGSWKIQSM